MTPTSTASQSEDSSPCVKAWKKRSALSRTSLPIATVRQLCARVRSESFAERANKIVGQLVIHQPTNVILSKDVSRCFHSKTRMPQVVFREVLYYT
jgi:hypothetical protein